MHLGEVDPRLRVERADSVLRITLVDPERRNAQTPSMWSSLAAVGASIDDDVRVIVLGAEGASFSAGLDRRMLTPDGVPGETSLFEILSRDDAGLDAFLVEAQSAFTWWRESAAITIAAVQGHAIGAGAQLMLACDIAVVAEDLQFALREPSLGMIPDLGGTEPLVRRVGYHRALEICATGRFVGADEALAIGLVDRVAPTSGLQAAVDGLVSQLLAVPTHALGSLKPLLAGAVDRDRTSQLAAERAAQLPLLRALGGTSSSGGSA